jgi:hypothetical protein
VRKHKIILFQDQRTNPPYASPVTGKLTEYLQVVCLQSGFWIEIMEPTPATGAPQDLVERAIYYMNGQDHVPRCKGHKHELVRQKK